jgi:hypothetical protein
MPGMRLLFLILVLVNVMFCAYAFLARQQSGGPNQIPLLQINPERIRVIKVVRDTASAKSAAQTPGACLEWGLFAGPETGRAEAAIAKLQLPQPLVQRAVATSGGYWVYIPPLKAKAEVDKKIAELKASGITDFFVVQDQSQWRNAISLGIFKSDEAAKSFLAALQEKGVRSATAERRENFLKQIAYYVREPSEAMVARLAELQREFPGTEIKAVACPPADAGRNS